MACKTSYELHHNFPKLAEETGFAFNTHRPRIHIDWNKIKLIDIDSLTRDRKFVLLEQHVNDILDCVLESEFDVRILDEGVVKLFRLAQLAVEYQQFCRHYLDRSVFVLRQEIDTLAQQLANARKDLQDREEELRKLRRKGKPHYNKSLLPYGNDNIAAMILKTLTNKSDIFPSTMSGEVPQYNKCNFCDKAFLNQLYLKSHISRRHANLLHEPPERDVKDTGPTELNRSGSENDKLNEEISQLKSKIKEMEILITNNNKVVIDREIIQTKATVKSSPSKEMKDAEVLTHNDDVFQKLEEWKKAEQENHSKEINLLRNQIIETLNHFKLKENEKPDESETKIVKQLYATIKDQGAKILSLKQALTETKLKSENEDQGRKKEFEEHMLHWAKRDETQSKQYELLLQKLNEVAQEARESRALAEAERQRAGQLEALLRERLTNDKHPENSSEGDSVPNTIEDYDDPELIEEPKLKKKSKPDVDHNTLEQLHRKAQELLNMESSSSSDPSSPILQKHHALKPTKIAQTEKVVIKGSAKKSTMQVDDDTPTKKINKNNYKEKTNKLNNNKTLNHKQDKVNKNQPKTHQKDVPKPSPRRLKMLENEPVRPPGSPVKLVRARITEEVNSRLVQAGVDPLKSRLNQNVYQKQKTQLQQQLEIKAKKYPAYEQVRYTIMAYLDSDASNKNQNSALRNSFTTPNALTKAFSLSSMISNVKSKALSLVKNKELKRKSESKPSTSEFAKKAIALLKTPPESPEDSNLRSSSPRAPDQDRIFSSRHETETNADKILPRLVKRKMTISTPEVLESDSEESSNLHEPTIAIPQRPARSIDNLIKSPIRRPSSANADYGNTALKYAASQVSDDDHLLRTQSVTNILKFGTDDGHINKVSPQHDSSSNDDINALLQINKIHKVDSRRSSPKQTKSVLKNASSTSSLSKKKVIFDMDAIQMKSVSASPSQSLTEKSDDKYELGLINIGDEEWDISSIENEPIKNDTKIHVNPGQSIKIAELKQTIEAQLARRSSTPSTAVFGGVDVLRGPMTKSSNIGGSNTSLGSSILDDSDSAKVANPKPTSIVKSKNKARKDDSDLDISDFSIDEVTRHKSEKDSF